MRPRSSGGRNERARSWRETGSDERALVAAPMVRSQMPSVLPYRRPLHRLYPASSRAWRDTGHASGALATVLAAMGSGAGGDGAPSGMSSSTPSGSISTAFATTPALARLLGAGWR